MTSTEFFIIDSSSLIDLKPGKGLHLNRRQSEKAPGILGEWCHEGQLFFPQQVVVEVGQVEKEDEISRWAKEHGAHARKLPRITSVRSYLEDLVADEVLPQLPKLIDPTKPRGEDADPWIVAMGIHLIREFPHALVRTITEDRSDTERKTGLVTGCGHFGIPAVSIRWFAEQFAVF